MKSATMKGFQLLLFAWTFFAISSVGYNVIKGGIEYNEWWHLTDSQKRQKIFGNIFIFLSFIDDNTQKTSEILLFSQDIKTYYLSKYYLYPRIVTTTTDKNKIIPLLKSRKFSYVALHTSKLLPSNYLQDNSYILLSKNSFGFLYKLHE